VVEHLPDTAKEELIEALGVVKKTAGHYQRCLGVQIRAEGRFDPQATRAAADRYRRALSVVEEITSDSVPPAGLFRDEERAR
jgi:hypothetical protein